MDQLSQYIADSGKSLRWFASECGVSASFISEITHSDPEKRKHPSLAVAMKIEAATKGAVPLGSWPKLAEIANAFKHHTPSNQVAS